MVAVDVDVLTGIVMLAGVVVVGLAILAWLAVMALVGGILCLAARVAVWVRRLGA